MKTIRILSLAIILLMSNNSFAVTHIITVANFSFTPKTLNVTVGDIIRWQWSGGSHTTTSKVIPNGAAAWDTPLNSSSTSFEYTVTVAGVYNYVCKPHEGMGMTGTFTASVANEIQENTSTLNFSIYPNPATSFINITSGMNGEAVLSNILGKNLKKFQLSELPIIANSYQFDISDLKDGIYVITLFSLDGQKPKSLKFVKKE